MTNPSALTVEDNTTASSGVELEAAVSHYGNASSAPSYEIAPEHQHIADAIVGMDIINDVPSPHGIPEGWRSMDAKLDTLPPELQGQVRARLQSVPDHLRAAKESEFTLDAIRDMRAQLRIMTGVGANATPYHKAAVGIAGEVRNLRTRNARIQEQLEWVASYRTTEDETTGEARPEPVYFAAGNMRSALLAEQAENERRLRLLLNEDGTYGREGAARIKQALHESVHAQVALQEQREEAAEVARRAKEMAREERIHARARARANGMKNDF